MSRIRPAAAALAAAALLAQAPTARADLVWLHDGKTIEGKVTRSGRKVTVKGYKGSTTYADSEVKNVEAGECTWDAVVRMGREIPPDASDALYIEKHLQIARYVKERRRYAPETQELENKEYEAVLKKDPNNDEARTGLGHVKWGQWWFKNEKDRDAKKKGAPAAEMEPLGYVKVKKTGTWELKEDAEAIEAGKVRFKGKWMTEDEKKIAQGYVKDEKGAWVLARDVKAKERLAEVEKELGEKPVAVTASRTFRITSWLTANETAELKDLCQRTYEKHREILGIPLEKGDEAEDDLFPEPIDVFVLVDGARKDKWVNSYGKSFGWNDSSIEFHIKGSGWHGLAPYPYLLSSGAKAEKNRQRDAENDMANARAQLTSMVGRIVCDRIRGGAGGAWFQEGNAFLAEIGMNETADCCYVTETKYREDIANKQGSKAKYYEFLKSQISLGLDRTMRQLFTLHLNNLDWADSVKAWSFLDFLYANYRDQFRQMYKVPLAEVEEITGEQIQAAIDADKPKDPSAAAGPKKKDEGKAPEGTVKVRGPGAVAVTEGSKEERAMRAASVEQWITLCVKKDIVTLENEWKAWVLAKR
jgi:hypothetical protein